MKFPDFVPLAVRQALNAYLHGGKGSGDGLVGSLRRAEAELARLRGELNECLAKAGRLPAGEAPKWLSEKILNLRREIARQSQSIEQTRYDVGAIRRLGYDARMKEAYRLIVREWPGDMQQRGFIYAAWASRLDYRPFRDELKQAADLAAAIESKARELSELLRRFHDTGLYRPGVFYSVAELLRSTDSREDDGRNLHMWRSDRRSLGLAPEREGEADASSAGPDTIVLGPSRGGDAVHLAWQTAPSLAELLDTLADAARDYSPEHGGMVGAAVASRKHSPKVEYLRAFLHVLREVHGIEANTPQAQRAVAIVADVVLDDPDLEVTYDDVRKAQIRLT
ncbi:hypothetical protein LCC91_05380 [Tepidimonas taiwanensis]|uniref:Uncharacterized protein n=1 Tax=Tepidimonas taiwanensis TaxID=307486 RepID=A0A554X0I5_9BURK|nr:hypothetical protein [Tepidimonas taiwanensis]TSE29334.1 hypothetical protein Ttaiw_02322 [Tepidimonas taiwanensis]UBQ06510.1 hypothetical protein LCC91_05380 [Tepidimonas taiwanensis]